MFKINIIRIECYLCGSWAPCSFAYSLFFNPGYYPVDIYSRLVLWIL